MNKQEFNIAIYTIKRKQIEKLTSGILVMVSSFVVFLILGLNMEDFILKIVCAILMFIGVGTGMFIMGNYPNIPTFYQCKSCGEYFINYKDHPKEACSSNPENRLRGSV